MCWNLLQTLKTYKILFITPTSTHRAFCTTANLRIGWVDVVGKKIKDVQTQTRLPIITKNLYILLSRDTFDTLRLWRCWLLFQCNTKFIIKKPTNKHRALFIMYICAWWICCRRVADTYLSKSYKIWQCHALQK